MRSKIQTNQWARDLSVDPWSFSASPSAVGFSFHGVSSLARSFLVVVSLSRNSRDRFLSSLLFSRRVPLLTFSSTSTSRWRFGVARNGERRKREICQRVSSLDSIERRGKRRDCFQSLHESPLHEVAERFESRVPLPSISKTATRALPNMPCFYTVSTLPIKREVNNSYSS